MSIYHKLNEILPAIVNPVVIEIGAHVGTDTARIVRLLQKPYLYIAIEPDDRNYPQLRKVCKEFGITIIPMAIGDKNGEVEFWYSNSDIKDVCTDFNSLKQPIDKVKGRPAWVKFNKGKVQCMRLDNLLINEAEQVHKVDLIWMDVQGAELEIIRGAPEVLKRTRYLYTECQEGRYEEQPGLARIIGALADTGKWRMEYRDPANVLLKNLSMQ